MLQDSQKLALINMQVIDLNQGYAWASCAPNQFLTPDLIQQQLTFKPAVVPCAFASLVSDAEAAMLDTQDHWLVTNFVMPENQAQRMSLQFDGLLTFADVYLNGELILQSRNAFHVHQIEVTNQLQTSNQLAICFRAIAPHYQAKQPRGRFPTRLIEQRHLRFIRTPVLGYMPGFAPNAKPVGAYRPITLVLENQFSLKSKRVHTTLVDDAMGKLEIAVELLPLPGVDLNQMAFELVVQALDTRQEISRKPVSFVKQQNGTIGLAVTEVLANINAYWPHTHGLPNRYKLTLNCKLNGFQMPISLGEVGFKRVERVEPNSFGLKINGVPLFLRGACWTPMNVKTLLADADLLRERLNLLKNAGFNMLRISGNMPYESDDFYQICDELGILIFQDFAFSNFDYPEDATDFVASIQKEATDFLTKHAQKSCLTVLAGGSEVYQQAAMMGLPLNGLKNAIFESHLREIAQDFAPNILYVASSPSGNQIPFHAGDGPSHYYGVGGYLRGFDDARLFKGRFAAECLAFSHMPEESSLRTFFDGEIPPPHHPLFKAAIPRDPGSGWDFSDTTDFYLEKLFGCNAVQLRAIDPQKYRALCRLTTMEVVERTMSIFRANSAAGRAALVWFLNDVKNGAGWGYIDTLGQPKSAFYGLSRVAQPTTLVFVDEGLEGLGVYLAHDGAKVLECELTIALITAEGQVLAQHTAPQTLQPRSIQRVSVDAFLGRFVDSSYAYKFGPRSFVAVVAKLTHQGKVLSQKVYTEPELTQISSTDLGLTASSLKINETQYQVTISAQKPVFYANLEVAGYVVSDQYFHVMPGFDYAVTLQKTSKATLLLGKVRTFNSQTHISITQLN